MAAPSTPGSSAVTVATVRASTSALICAQVAMGAAPPPSRTSSTARHAARAGRAGFAWPRGGGAGGPAAEPSLVARDAGRAFRAREHDSVDERDAFERRPHEIATPVLARQAEEGGAQIRIPERHALARKIRKEDQRRRMARLRQRARDLGGNLALSI